MTKSDHQRVIEAIEDRYYEEGYLSKKSDIQDWTGLSGVGGIIDDLIGNEIYPIYKSKGDPTIYATKQMKNSLTSKVGEPDWIDEYEFREKRDLKEEVSEANNKIDEYQRLERLLFGTGTPLEESVELTFEKLDLDFETTEEYEDILLNLDDATLVIEIKGKSGQIEKSDVTQLQGWLEKKIDEGYKAEELHPLLIHNANRNEPPKSRGEPLTPHASEFLNLLDGLDTTTSSLFDIIKNHKEKDASKGETVGKLKEELM